MIRREASRLGKEGNTVALVNKDQFDSFIFRFDVDR